jgi:hypothetical protein
MTSAAKSVTHPNVATLQTDYAFALTHSQQEVSDPCQNVMQGSGDDLTVCGLNCLVTCPACGLDACDDKCLEDLHRSLGCEKK